MSGECLRKAPNRRRSSFSDSPFTPSPFSLFVGDTAQVLAKISKNHISPLTASFGHTVAPSVSEDTASKKLWGRKEKTLSQIGNLSADARRRLKRKAAPYYIRDDQSCPTETPGKNPTFAREKNRNRAQDNRMFDEDCVVEKPVGPYLKHSKDKDYRRSDQPPALPQPERPICRNPLVALPEFFWTHANQLSQVTTQSICVSSSPSGTSETTLPSPGTTLPEAPQDVKRVAYFDPFVGPLRALLDLGSSLWGWAKSANNRRDRSVTAEREPPAQPVDLVWPEAYESGPDDDSYYTCDDVDSSDSSDAMDEDRGYLEEDEVHEMLCDIPLTPDSTRSSLRSDLSQSHEEHLYWTWEESNSLYEELTGLDVSLLGLPSGDAHSTAWNKSPDDMNSLYEELTGLDLSLLGLPSGDAHSTARDKSPDDIVFAPSPAEHAILGVPRPGDAPLSYKLTDSANSHRRTRTCTVPEPPHALDPRGDIILTPKDLSDEALLSNHQHPRWRHHRFRPRTQQQQVRMRRARHVDEVRVERRVPVRYSDEGAGELERLDEMAGKLKVEWGGGVVDRRTRYYLV
ncbi:hypothetical protein K439DRAFT_1155624 [Ramaria rubella]|nr:hypothetical protein K439DRAFT_1155624 [Ramaria rubella]